ncbi:hypothetical protein ncot_11840 [Nocardioides sp. JQ2195]|uniref:phospholipase D family protein n=1 Tax=Nocardioides sp. JQ2195 TaxID=2592334 RepID=UPI00143EBE33|nr:phospholipase D family protein [Nocardioides sp. JQ2195]QIX27214.1 hypothetical protein ncot_11840 [Nocardioides sp. JQ2195]
MDQLAPPNGAKFDRAVATTFALDLTATLLPALAFTGFHLASGTSDPIATLESIRSTADRIDVFCQAGAIGVPEKSPDLLAFLEPMVHPVRPPSSHGLFHPKVWFIRYVDDAGPPSYRLLVLTRNLTMDSSWDLAVRLDSESIAKKTQPASAALRDFLVSLPDRATPSLSGARRKAISELADEAGRIVWELPPSAEQAVLHYLNPNRKRSTDFSGARHLVVSPFVDAAGLSRIRPKGEIQILSRAEELEKLETVTTSRLKARVLDELAVSQEVEGSRLGGQLHAKMYVVEQSQNWSKSHVFIGSANATGAAFTNNTEFLVEIRGHKNHFGIERFLGDDGTFMAMTEPYQPTEAEVDEAEDALQRELENAVRRVAGMTFSVEVISSGTDDTHDLHLTSEKPFSLEPGWHATVELLTLPEHGAPVGPGVALDTVVPAVPTPDITPFLAIRVVSPTGLLASTVVVAALINEPKDRLDVVLARQMDSPDKFLRFLFFLLSLGKPAALVDRASTRSTGTGGASPFGEGGSGVLEMVLGALATRPEALADLDALVARLEGTEAGRKALPEGFSEFWSVVRDAATANKELA